MISTVVMVSYNRDSKLRKSLEKLLNTSLDEIVVVDNNSRKKTRDILDEMASLDSRVKLIKLDRNLGASYGFFMGLQYIEASYNTCVITFLDDDAYFDQSFIENLSNYYAKFGAECSYISPIVINENGKRLDMNRPMTIVPNSFKKTIEYIRKRRRFGEKTESVEAASFIGLTIMNKNGENCSSLIPKDYFIYFDDLAFSYRISKKHKLKGMLVEDLKVIHDIENGRREFDEFRLTYMLSNCIKFNTEINGSVFLYPFFVHLHYFIKAIRERKLKVFVNAAFRKKLL